MSGPPPRMADCHPDRKHCARGLCSACYTVQVARPKMAPGVYNAYQRTYARANRDKRLVWEAAWRAEHAEEVQFNRRRRTLAAYGLTPEAYTELLGRQGGGCAVCGAPPPSAGVLHVDHSHGTGAVRGLLCTNCNNGLGRFRDDAALLLAAASYLAA